MIRTLALIALVTLAACDKPSAPISPPAGAPPATSSASSPPPATPASPTPAATTPGIPASPNPNAAAESKSPPSTGPGNTGQVQESSAHGATQTTEDKGKK